MVPSLQETKYDLSLLLLLSQPNQLKFKQQQITQFKYKSTTKKR